MDFSKLSKHYSKIYKKNKSTAVYPAEFVVRAFLGTYPNLRMSRRYEGKRILDLGYGDGRNMPLLKNLRMNIFGVEISDEINRHVQKRLSNLGIKADLKKGTNARIPYNSGFFHYLLACHSCYYVESGGSFNNNLAEMARVLKPNGFFIASLPMKDTYILKGAKPLKNGHYQITNDPYDFRNGTVFRVFRSEEEIKKTLSIFFDDFSVGYCNDLFWGIHQKVWIVVCRKRASPKN